MLPGQWAKERNELAAWFPSYLQLSESTVRGSVRLNVWVRPIPPKAEQQAIVEDLRNDRIVNMEVSGRLRHFTEYAIPHPKISNSSPPALRDRLYQLHIDLMAGHPTPAVSCTTPSWNKSTLSGHTHFNDDDTICAIFGPDKTWTPVRDSLSDFLFQTCIWLFKTEYWLSTGATAKDREWLGTDQSHDAESLSRIPPTSPCFCGSMKEFGSCCRAKIVSLVQQRRAPST